MIKNIKDIENALGLKDGEFKTLWEDKEDKDLDITSFEIIKKDDLATRIGNEKSAAATAATEVMIKKSREKLGLDFTGKTIENLLDAYGKKVIADAKIDPDKKVKELQGDLDLVKGNYDKVFAELNETKTTFKKSQETFKIESTILNKLPKTNTVIPADEMAIIFKTKYSPALSEDGKVVFHGQDGQVLKNKTTASPLTIDEVVAEFQTPYIKQVAGGPGGGDGTGQQKPGSFEAFDAEMEKAGITPQSQKYNEEMQKRIKDKTLVV